MSAAVPNQGEPLQRADHVVADIENEQVILFLRQPLGELGSADRSYHVVAISLEYPREGPGQGDVLGGEQEARVERHGQVMSSR